MVVLAVHIVTAELDAFAPVGWAAVAIPFASAYRPIWLGLGTVAFDLLIALTVTSVLRNRLGYRTWRAVHWLAYLSWPVALVHGLGTGSDARVGWMQWLTVLCVAAVLAAGAWRLSHGWPAQARPRVAGGAAGAVIAVVIAVWALSGPLRPGWAKRAGTPAPLLATARTPATTTSPTGPTVSLAPSSPAATGLPAVPFSATVTGTLNQSNPGASGQVTVTIDTKVTGTMVGSLDIVLRGQSSGGGVSLDSSTVTFGPSAAPSRYQGSVTALDGDQLAVSVAAGIWHTPRPGRQTADRPRVGFRAGHGRGAGGVQRNRRQWRRPAVKWS